MRLVGWEQRLADLVADAAKRDYRLGEHDCAKFACETVAALTGRTPWGKLAGRYATRADSIRLIRSFGDTVERAIEIVFEVEQTEIRRAGRGDLYLFVDRALPHLAVGLGARVAVLLPSGLGFVRADNKRLAAAWRVD